MDTKKKLIMAFVVLATQRSFASEIREFKLPLGQKINVDGTVTIDFDKKESAQKNKNVSTSFYGSDTHGFSVLPEASLVTPLELGFVKFGGNLHSTYNFEFNAYYDSSVFYVYAPLERRIRMAQENYKTKAMFQVNMLGWQPDTDSAGQLVYKNTATANHAADALTYLNLTKKLKVEHILMGNEPFQSMETHQKKSPSADEYIENYFKYALALRERAEEISGNPNAIKLWGPEVADGWTGWQTAHPDDCDQDMKCSYGNGEFSEFIPYFLSQLEKFENDETKNPKHYKMLDYLSWHYYPLFRKKFSDNGSIILNANGAQNVEAMLDATNVWDSETFINKFDYASPRGITPKLIKKFTSWRDSYYPNAKLAVTEFAVDSVGNIDYHPIVRPLYLADLMGKLATNGVDTFVNSFLQGGAFSSDWAMINGREKSNTYNVYSLFSNFFKGEVLDANDSFGNVVNTYSVKLKNETNIVFVNKDKIVHSTSLNFKKDGNINEITNLSLPAWSITVLTVKDGSGQSIKVRQYGALEMGIKIE